MMCRVRIWDMYLFMYIKKMIVIDKFSLYVTCMFYILVPCSYSIVALFVLSCDHVCLEKKFLGDSCT